MCLLSLPHIVSLYFSAAARKLLEHGGDQALLKLRSAPYEEGRTFLLGLPGIGNKVSCHHRHCLFRWAV